MFIRGHSISTWAWYAVEKHGGAILLWSFIAACAIAFFAAGVGLTLQGLGVGFLIIVAGYATSAYLSRNSSYPGQGY